jgi:hypothetical protein
MNIINKKISTDRISCQTRVQKDYVYIHVYIYKKTKAKYMYKIVFRQSHHVVDVYHDRNNLNDDMDVH